MTVPPVRDLAVKAGHRIRREISSSSFPHYDRNLNTGHEFGQDAAVSPAAAACHDAAVLGEVAAA